jgi:hypothetical protein
MPMACWTLRGLLILDYEDFMTAFRIESLFELEADIKFWS